jgi:hypothetical protein
MRCSCHKRQHASADKVQVKAANILPLLDSPDPSKTQSTVGTVLSIYTAPASRGPYISYRPVEKVKERRKGNQRGAHVVFGGFLRAAWQSILWLISDPEGPPVTTSACLI